MDKVNVILSTYNGEKYISEQLESILLQTSVETFVTIRDDGSTDNTVKCIEEWKSRYPNRIEYIVGDNIGYRRSFLTCLKHAKDDYDYYAFADQDDVWCEEKCIRGIKKIHLYKEECAVYACSLSVTDDKLSPLYKNDITSSPNTLLSFFSRMRLPGCCMLFTKKTKKIAELFSDLSLDNEFMLDHDFIVGTVGYACGHVVRDDKEMILHRRQSKSLTNGGKGIIARIKGEYGVVFKRKDIKYTIAKMMLNFDNDNKIHINNEASEFFSTIKDYKNSLACRWKLLTYKGFSSGIFLGDLEVRIKVLLGNY